MLWASCYPGLLLLSLLSPSWLGQLRQGTCYTGKSWKAMVSDSYMLVLVLFHAAPWASCSNVMLLDSE